MKNNKIVTVKTFNVVSKRSKKKSSTIYSEFKEFAVKGNVVDLAVAFVMGAAFSQIVTALVNGIIMPIIGKMTFGTDLDTLKVVLTPAKYDKYGNETVTETAIQFGHFISVTIDFIIIAFVLFIIVKNINRLKRKHVVESAAAPEPTQEELLLREIRDLLKEKNQ
jgi:large conductance mechanosensitive channel